jgi:hypothetical protein
MSRSASSSTVDCILVSAKKAPQPSALGQTNKQERQIPGYRLSFFVRFRAPLPDTMPVLLSALNHVITGYGKGPKDEPSSPDFWWKISLSAFLVVAGGVFAGCATHLSTAI